MQKAKRRIRQSVTIGLVLALLIIGALAWIWHRAELDMRCGQYVNKSITETPADCREYLLKVGGQ